MQEMRVGKKTCGIEKRGITLLRCLQRCPLPDVDILQEKRRLKRLKRRKFIRKIYCAITKRKQGPKGKKGKYREEKNGQCQHYSVMLLLLFIFIWSTSYVIKLQFKGLVIN